MGHKLRIILTFLLTGFLVSQGAKLPAQTAPPDDATTQETLKFAQIYGLVSQHYADPINPDHAIFDGAIREMLSTLDPFSAFFDQDQFQLLQQQTRGEAMGFGSILYVQPGKVLVLQAAEGSPSWRAGLGPGDEIVEINGQRVDRLEFQSLVELLRSSRSHPVHLGVIHPGKNVAQDVELKPAEVDLPSVDRSFVLPGRNIGYLHITGFEAKTTQEVEKAVEQMGGSKLKGLLLDLRNNHGGMVATAVGVASLFLKPGVPVLTMRGRSVPEKTYNTTPSSTRFDMPMVVLVNGETASAAELLAAALEEHDRAVLAGEQTYGKGVVENVLPLSNKTGLALTVAQYFTPSGRSIQRPLPGTALAATDRGIGKDSRFHTDNGRPVTAAGGITPDVTIPAPDLDPWVQFLNERGFFTAFASNYLTFHREVNKTFEPDSKVLSAFRDFLGEQRIRVPAEYWTADQDYLKLRIKTEVFNLLFGLTEGNHVEVQGDPQVRKALALFPVIQRIMEGPAQKPQQMHVKRVSAQKSIRRVKTSGG